MVDKLHLSFFCIASLTLWTSCLSASPLPSELQSALQVREQQLNHLNLACRMIYTESDAADSSEEIREKQQAVKDRLPDELRRAGITDEVGIQQQVQSNVDHIARSGKAAVYHSTTPCQFQHYDDQVLIVGVRQLSDDHSMSSEPYRYFYSNNTGALINDGNVINNKSYPSTGINVWKSAGKSFYYRSPDARGLGLLPEHLVMLLGLNPLAMHGAHWELVSETYSAYHLHCEFETDNLLPLDIQLTLDRLHRNAPSEIKIAIAGGKEIITLNAQSYILYNGEWISNKVVCHTHSAKFDNNQIWITQNISDSKPITLTVNPTMFVRDYRLLGGRIGNIMMITNGEKGSVVTYRWPGHLPTLDELKTMQQEQHPGESTPDPGRSSSALPVIGGMMCLVGGVWMFKRRGLS